MVASGLTMSALPPLSIHQDWSGVEPAVVLDRDKSAAIRKWARENGYAVSRRGRISFSIVAAFSAAHLTRSALH